MIVRPSRTEDAAAMAGLLNEIIASGGTTAHQDPMSEDDVRCHYITGPEVLSSVVAEVGGAVVGWQATELWQGEVHIGTFVKPGLQAKGAGSAMFPLTCQVLREKGAASIVASIRSDNVPGLTYYGRLGFCDFDHDPGFALKDGRVVGRVHRRFELL